MSANPPSTSCRRCVWLLLAAGLVLSACGRELNAWPFWVGQEDDSSDRITTAQALGPLYAERHLPDGSAQQAWRPFLLWQRDARGESAHFLYPLFSWEVAADYRAFTLFRLINYRLATRPDATTEAGFDVWPLYFSRATGDPATSYRALLPVAGTIKHRFGKDELRWVAFPLYFQVTARGRETRYTPWPFIRTISGDGHRGFEVWPLAGRRERAGDYREQFYLWPLIYRQERNLSAPQPDVRSGVLPFYTRDTGPGYLNENYLWPFFGHTDRTEPQRYQETRYLWPFLVQGRGDDRQVNRWAPFYSHSVVKGYDKTWVLWPLLRQAKWTDGDIAQERTQFLIFLLWSTEQRSLSRPDAAPASKRHLWPLASVWDNGAGRRQVQVLSPLEVFFPTNEPVRQLYTPFFALYRYDRRAPDDTRWSFLWNAVSHHRSPARSEFHLGPLFGTRRDAAGERVAIGAGLLSWRRPAGEKRWQFSLFDFRRRTDKPSPPDASP